MTAIPLLRFLPRPVIAAVAVVCLAAPGLADDLPALRPGLWEFTRTMEIQGGGKPQTINNKKCADPSADMKRMNEMLANQGCKVSPVVRHGNSYTFSSDCKMQGAQVQSRSVLTFESDNAYTVEVTSSHGGGSTKELLKAKRVGDCKP